VSDDLTQSGIYESLSGTSVAFHLNMSFVVIC